MGGCCIGDSLILDAIGDFFFGGGGCGDCCVSNSPGPSKSERHAKKVAEELAEMREKVMKSSSEAERNLIDYINGSMNSFINYIEQEVNQQSYSGEKLNINVYAIREKNKQLSSKVVGYVSSVLDTRLVQSDRELSTILEEKNDKKRKANFEAFVKRVKREALDKLKDEIDKTVRAQSEVVSSEIEARQKEINARLKESIDELTKIMEMKEKNDANLKKKQINYMYQCALCDLLLAEVEG